MEVAAQFTQTLHMGRQMEWYVSMSRNTWAPYKQYVSQEKVAHHLRAGISYSYEEHEDCYDDDDDLLKFENFFVKICCFGAEQILPTD